MASYVNLLIVACLMGSLAYLALLANCNHPGNHYYM